jgi:hypothetical protein
VNLLIGFDKDQIKREYVNQDERTKREYTNIKQDLTQEFLKYIRMSEECEMNRDTLEAIIYKDIADEINAALKKFDM